MAPNSPACCFVHVSMAGSRSTAPLNRSSAVLIGRSTLCFRDRAPRRASSLKRDFTAKLEVARRGDITVERSEAWALYIGDEVVQIGMVIEYIEGFAADLNDDAFLDDEVLRDAEIEVHVSK